MLDTYPRTVGIDADMLAAAIDALNDCAQACTADVDADLSEQNLTEMVTCIRLCLHCADVCTATAGSPAARRKRRQRHQAAAAACAAVCKSCGDECERHARMHEHCRFSAEACRRCEQACRRPGRHEIGRPAIPGGPGASPSPEPGVPTATPAGSHQPGLRAVTGMGRSACPQCRRFYRTVRPVHADPGRSVAGD